MATGYVIEVVDTNEILSIWGDKSLANDCMEHYKNGYYRDIQLYIRCIEPSQDFMSVNDIKEYIFEHCGFNMFSNMGTGSLKGYTKISTLDTSNKIPRKVYMKLKELLWNYNSSIHPVTTSAHDIIVYGINV